MRPPRCELPIGDADEPHEWERVELSELDVHESDFFAKVWEPWRLQLMSGSHLALEGIKAVLQPGGAGLPTTRQRRTRRGRRSGRSLESPPTSSSR